MTNTGPHQQQCHSNKVASCIDNVVSTLLLVWTGLRNG